LVPPTREELVDWRKEPKDDETEVDKEKRENTQAWVTENMPPCVRGAKDWKQICSTVPLSETDFTPSDEAFVIVASINMWVKWAKRDGVLEDDEDVELDEETRKRKRKAEKGLYTGGGSNRKFGGWSVEGLERYNELFDIAVQRRSAAWAAGMENAVKDRLRERNFTSASLDEVRMERLRMKRRSRAQGAAAIVRHPKMKCDVNLVEV
jgi:hypothetical protein